MSYMEDIHHLGERERRGEGGRGAAVIINESYIFHPYTVIKSSRIKYISIEKLD